MVVCRPAAVIPANAGIQQHNAAGLYRKKPNPHRRHSRAGGNPKTQRNRNLSEKTEPPHRRHSRESGNPATEKPQESISKNRNPTDRHSRKSGNPETQRSRTLSEKTETPPPSFPQKRESRPVGTESYRIKQFP